MRVSVGMDMGMGSGMPGMGMEEQGMFASLISSLPMWAQGLLLALAVIAGGWIAGIIIGKLYASVKYPDPEKPSLINPLLKIGLGAAIIACGFWIYSSFTKPNEPVVPEGEMGADGMMQEEVMPEGEIPSDGEIPSEGEISTDAEAVPAEVPEEAAAAEAAA